MFSFKKILISILIVELIDKFSNAKTQPYKPGRMATKAPRHKQYMFIIHKLGVLVAKIFTLIS